MNSPLPSDVTRCYGEPDHPLCAVCARKMQIEHDSLCGWYSYMQAVPHEGTCSHYIAGGKDA